jgi:hypothetical protein
VNHPSTSPENGARDEEPRRGRCNELLVSFLSFVLIAFTVWIISGTRRYRMEYAETTQGWRVGSTRSVEISLVRDDKTNLACASDQTIAGLRCGHGSDQGAVTGLSADKPELLQPYNTVGGELFLGAGLWTAPDMKQALPTERFSAVCNYNIKGVIKSALIRFAPTAAFGPTNRTVTVGALTDCTVPR